MRDPPEGSSLDLFNSLLKDQDVLFAGRMGGWMGGWSHFFKFVFLHSLTCFRSHREIHFLGLKFALRSLCSEIIAIEDLVKLNSFSSHTLILAHYVSYTG